MKLIVKKCLLATAIFLTLNPAHSQTRRHLTLPTPALFDPLGLFQNLPAGGLFQTDPIKALQGFTVADIQRALNRAGRVLINNGGGGYAIKDSVTLANGIVVTVSQVGATGNITGVTTDEPGLFAANAPIVPAISTSGKGMGALFGQKDMTAATCYTALIPLVEQTVENPLPTGLGVFEAFQAARDAVNSISNAQANLISGPLNSACAPLALSARNTILMLGAAVGVKGSTFAIAPFPH